MNKIEELIINKLQEMKCKNIKVYDVKNMTPLNEVTIVATSRTSSTLWGTIHAVARVLHDEGIEISHIEHRNSTLWCLLDANAYLIHVFIPGERERMKFDDLFKKCPVIYSDDEEIEESEEAIYKTEVSFYDEEI